MFFSRKKETTPEIVYVQRPTELVKHKGMLIDVTQHPTFKEGWEVGLHGSFGKNPYTSGKKSRLWQMGYDRAYGGVSTIIAEEDHFNQTLPQDRKDSILERFRLGVS